MEVDTRNEVVDELDVKVDDDDEKVVLDDVSFERFRGIKLVGTIPSG